MLTGPAVFTRIGQHVAAGTGFEEPAAAPAPANLRDHALPFRGLPA